MSDERTTLMKLLLENIGMLKHAELSLHQLCVIAGENDNGKSTIGKIVFCIVKAINKYQDELQVSKEYQLREKVEEIYFYLRNNAKDTSPDIIDSLRKLRFFSGRSINITETLPILDTTIQEVFERVHFEADTHTKTRALRNEVQAIINEPENVTQSIEKALDKAFASEFDSSLLLQGTTEGRIQLVENNLKLIDLEVTNDGVKLVTDVEPIILKDATFIDTPLILNNHDILARSQTLFDIDQRRSTSLGQPFTTLHTKDLFDKLRQPTLPPTLFDEDRVKISDEIRAIIDGEITYDRSERDFVFQRKGESVSIKNTASGIKVFGLLNILINNEFIAKNTILIFDEPENHLHPKWQLKLAKLLLKLVDNGVYILVSSHSPYLIEALARATEHKHSDIETRFALAEKNTIEDKNRLGDIFNTLAEPFEVFRKMDEEVLR